MLTVIVRAKCYISFCLLLGMFVVTSGASFSRCDEKSAICGAECVATERILNLYGLYATGSILISLPRINSVYVLCFSRINQHVTPPSSDVFCMTGTMDEMQTVQPHHVVTIPGIIINFEEFHEDSSQYVLIHTDSQPVQMYEIVQQERFYVSFSFVHAVGGPGAAQSVMVKANGGPSGVVIATTSGRLCQAGDLACVSPAVHTLIGESLTQCAVYQSQEPLTAGLVTGWNDGTTAYVVFSNPFTDNSPVFGLHLFRVAIAPGGGECHLEFVQDILGGEPICGVRSMEVVRSFDGSTFLLVARQPCPDVHTGLVPLIEANIVLKLWDINSKQFVYSPSARDLSGTTGVKKITFASDQFFVSQRESSPSTIHSTILPVGSSVVSTVRVHNDANLKAVQSRNGDVFLTHVTSVGAVVVDWLSCVVNQGRPANFSMTPYNSYRGKLSGRHPLAYRNNTGSNGKALSLQSAGRTPNGKSMPAIPNGIQEGQPIGTYVDSSNRVYPSPQPLQLPGPVYVPVYGGGPLIPQGGPSWFNPNNYGPAARSAPVQPPYIDELSNAPPPYPPAPLHPLLLQAPPPVNNNPTEIGQPIPYNGQIVPPPMLHTPQSHQEQTAQPQPQPQLQSRSEFNNRPPTPEGPAIWHPQPVQPYLSPPMYYQGPSIVQYRPPVYYGMYGPPVSPVVPYYQNFTRYQPSRQYPPNLPVPDVSSNYNYPPRSLPMAPQPDSYPIYQQPIQAPIYGYSNYLPPFPTLTGQARTTTMGLDQVTTVARVEGPEISSNEALEVDPQLVSQQIPTEDAIAVESSSTDTSTPATVTDFIPTTSTSFDVMTDSTTSILTESLVEPAGNVPQRVLLSNEVVDNSLAGASTTVPIKLAGDTTPGSTDPTATALHSEVVLAQVSISEAKLPTIATSLAITPSETERPTESTVVTIATEETTTANPLFLVIAGSTTTVSDPATTSATDSTTNLSTAPHTELTTISSATNIATSTTDSESTQSTSTPVVPISTETQPNTVQTEITVITEVVTRPTDAIPVAPSQDTTPSNQDISSTHETEPNILQTTTVRIAVETSTTETATEVPPTHASITDSTGMDVGASDTSTGGTSTAVVTSP